MLVWWKTTDHLAVLRCLAPPPYHTFEPSSSICLPSTTDSHLHAPKTPHSSLQCLPTPTSPAFVRPGLVSSCHLPSSYQSVHTPGNSYLQAPSILASPGLRLSLWSSPSRPPYLPRMRCPASHPCCVFLPQQSLERPASDS